MGIYYFYIAFLTSYTTRVGQWRFSGRGNNLGTQLRLNVRRKEENVSSCSNIIRVILNCL